MSFIQKTNTLEFNTQIYLPGQDTPPEKITALAQFLHDHLDEFGDPIHHIRMAINYALRLSDSPGGFVIAISKEESIAGVVVVNKTGMSGYIPENILVYIAVDRNFRGHGLGKSLMQSAIETAEGGIALHVEADNPAKFLYEKLGFENKYLEMRLQKVRP
jgi:ribosomal-protein-alanine N-acetyltransferase